MRQRTAAILGACLLCGHALAQEVVCNADEHAKTQRKRREAGVNMGLHPESSPYEVLGVPRDATHGQIRAAFRKLSRVCHPDHRLQSNRPNDIATEAQALVNRAMEILSDDKQRRNLDGFLATDGFRRHRRRGVYGTCAATGAFAGGAHALKLAGERLAGAVVSDRLLRGAAFCRKSAVVSAVFAAARLVPRAIIRFTHARAAAAGVGERCRVFNTCMLESIGLLPAMMFLAHVFTGGHGLLLKLPVQLAAFVVWAFMSANQINDCDGKLACGHGECCTVGADGMDSFGQGGGDGGGDGGRGGAGRKSGGRKG